ncbi:hypothetical protein EV368DRAFT_67065, partial [Lentinula lateritia]
MHLSTLFVALTTVACSLAVVANPTSVQSTSLTSRADCGTINGNCYDNDCDGDKSSDGLHCISGQYAGCPCGYGCNKNYVGPCDAFGCDGVGNLSGCVSIPGAAVEFKPSPDVITTTAVAYNAYIYSERPLTFLRISVVNAATFVTVGQVSDCPFNENGRQRYQLDTTTGSGCHYWCQTVVRDMMTKGWLSQDAPAKTEEIAAAIQAYNPEVVVSEVGRTPGVECSIKCTLEAVKAVHYAIDSPSVHHILIFADNSSAITTIYDQKP